MMKNKHVIELLPDYLDGLLEKNLKASVESHLKECEICSQELSQFKELLNAFKNEESAVPPSSIEAKFLEQLKEEKQMVSKVVPINSSANGKRNSWAVNLLKIAASVALLIGAFLTGKYQTASNDNKEIAQLTAEKIEFQQMAMLSLMENESASKRIQGVNYIDGFKNPDEAIVKALADRMLHDKNTNVRLAAVEALGNYTSSETVKKTFIEALKTEKDPSIQITIIHTLVNLHEKKAIEPMKKLLEEEETQPFVKSKIEFLLPNII